MSRFGALNEQDKEKHKNKEKKIPETINPKIVIHLNKQINLNQDLII